MTAETGDREPAAFKNQLETQLTLCLEMSRLAMDASAKLTELNIHVMKTLWASMAHMQRQFMAANSPAQLLATDAEPSQPNIAQGVAYGREFADIASSAQSSMLATLQKGMAQTREQMEKAAAAMSDRSAESVSDVIEITKSVLQADSTGYERFTEPRKEAAPPASPHSAPPVDKPPQDPAKGGSRQGK
jgi:phasin family protein